MSIVCAVYLIQCSGKEKYGINLFCYYDVRICIPHVTHICLSYIIDMYYEVHNVIKYTQTSGLDVLLEVLLYY